MALVGPRPLTRQELDAYYGPDASHIVSARPGLSGLWQISGRNRLTYAQRRRFDLLLVKKWSILRTMATCSAAGWSRCTRLRSLIYLLVVGSKETHALLPADKDRKHVFPGGGTQSDISLSGQWQLGPDVAASPLVQYERYFHSSAGWSQERRFRWAADHVLSETCGPRPLGSAQLTNYCSQATNATYCL